jgi:hypothetical protein
MVAKVAIKHEVIPAIQYAIGPSLFPFPPIMYTIYIISNVMA